MLRELHILAHSTGALPRGGEAFDDADTGRASPRAAGPSTRVMLISADNQIAGRWRATARHPASLLPALRRLTIHKSSTDRAVRVSMRQALSGVAAGGRIGLGRIPPPKAVGC